MNQIKIFFKSFSIMINHEKQVLKNVRSIFKLSDNRPEPPGLDLALSEKRCSLKKCRLKRMHFDDGFKMQMHSNSVNAFKISGKIKENYFSRSCSILWKLQKKNRKYFIFCRCILKSVASILKYFKSFLSN